MKRFLVLLLVFVFACAPAASAESVVQMAYTAKMSDVSREGVYTGEIKDGLPHGYGIFEAQNASGVPWHYIGQWENGEMNGQGGQYWDTGRCEVGTYQANAFVCGYMHQNTTQNAWINYHKNEHGCYEAKEYREDGTVYFDGCVNAETGLYHKGTIYTKDGEVFFTGEIGEGFDWNLLYVE